jgi:hypothetical protein
MYSRVDRPISRPAKTLFYNVATAAAAVLDPFFFV